MAKPYRTRLQKNPTNQTQIYSNRTVIKIKLLLQLYFMGACPNISMKMAVMGRTQQVVLDDTTSAIVPVISGVPLLFIMTFWTTLNTVKSDYLLMYMTVCSIKQFCTIMTHLHITRRPALSVTRLVDEFQCCQMPLYAYNSVYGHSPFGF